MARVTLQHLGKTFASGVEVLRDVTFDAADGEIFVLVGPSGCGKTTALRLIAGLDQPTCGEIMIDGRSMHGISPAARDVAMVFQDAALYPHMSVRQNLAFALKRLRLSREEIQRRIHEAATSLSIVDLLDRRPSELSGGQRRRAAIGRAIVRAPKVLLLDEPLSNLDPPSRAQLQAEFALLRARFSPTIIIVTHDQGEAMSLADRMAVMNAGEIQQIDAPQTVYDRPANAFVASFIGSPGMNLIAGEVRDGAFRWPMGVSKDETAALPMEMTKQVPSGPVRLGIRPCDLMLGNGEVNLPPVTIELVQRLGYESLAHFQLAGSRHVAKLPAEAAVCQGDQSNFWTRASSICLFAADGRRLN